MVALIIYQNGGPTIRLRAVYFTRGRARFLQYREKVKSRKELKEKVNELTNPTNQMFGRAFECVFASLAQTK